MGSGGGPKIQAIPESSKIEYKFLLKKPSKFIPASKFLKILLLSLINGLYLPAIWINKLSKYLKPPYCVFKPTNNFFDF